MNSYETQLSEIYYNYYITFTGKAFPSVARTDG